MNILHYTIGIPPNRRGGSIQYAFDLMIEQVRQGHTIYILICGDTLFRSRICQIKEIKKSSLPLFQLTNPITPTMIYGIKEPAMQYRHVHVDFENITKFIRLHEIEVLHMHTLMGIHKEVVALVKSLGVKIVYTCHDFYGICPHYNLIDFNGELCDKASGRKCAQCNLHEPSDFYLRLANSHLYQKIKRLGFIKTGIKTSALVAYSNRDDLNSPSFEAETYCTLLNHYKEYFSLIDKFHFNSLQTKEIFQHFVPAINGKIIPVLTRSIKDNRKCLNLSDVIEFGFIGSTKEYKGFPILKRVLMELKKEGLNNFRLKVYGGGMEGIDRDCENITYIRSYDYAKISQVLYHLDGIIVPSKWYETFSLVTLEALSHGRPVICSNHVGAKDIVAGYDEKFIFSSEEELKLLIKEVLNDPTILNVFNKEILSKPWHFDMQSHAAEIVGFYKE